MSKTSPKLRAVVGNITLTNFGQIKYLKVRNEFTNQTKFSENPELCVHEDGSEKETGVRDLQKVQNKMRSFNKESIISSLLKLRRIHLFRV